MFSLTAEEAAADHLGERREVEQEWGNGVWEYRRTVEVLCPAQQTL